MPRRQSSFARALSDAEKRLEKAQAERSEALAKAVALGAEIPRLQSIIASLSGKAAPAVKTADPEKAVTDIPEDLAKLVGPQDLSGMGSIPPLTEDQTLPDDFEVKK